MSCIESNGPFQNANSHSPVPRRVPAWPVAESSREYQYDDREFGLTSAIVFQRRHAIQSPCLMTSCTFQGDEGNSIIVRQTQAVPCTMI